jgi:photosystem II stability/assembly factor-like uncharacterized protein
MKKVIFIMIMGFLVNNSMYSQSGWIESNIGNSKLKSINFINNSTGFIFGYMNHFYKTTNGGETWQEFDTPSFAFSGYFLDEQNGILMGSFPYITRDGGETWTYGQGINPIGWGAAIIMKKGVLLNKDTAFICGNEFGMTGTPPQFYVTGKIYRTITGGQFWELVAMGGFDWNDIKADANGKIYCIQSGLITSTDFGLTWKYISGIPSYEGFSMSEIFGDTFYVSGSTGKITKTFNGGYNWSQYQTPLNDTLNNLFFQNNKTGWVVGDSGYIFHTTNAGINWIQQTVPTTTDINDVYFINKDTGFAVGDNGLLLKTYTGGMVGINNISTSIPDKYFLYQNYPNPFNPSTTIKFDIIKISDIRLYIYDVTGKQIAELVNEKLNPGTYEYSWNAEELSSGIYFYRLEAYNFLQTRRMILLK